MGNDPLDRRQFLQATSAAATTALLAGCGDGGGGDGDGGGGDGGGGEDGGMDDTETETETETETDGGGNETDGGGGGNAEVDEFLSDTSNYDSIQDETGSSEVSVAVGAEGNDGNFAFEPAAIEVDAGTDVVWEWTGQGGQHNVVDEDGEFESELTEEEGFTFTHTFEEAGTYLYACTPHRSLGMKGAVVVSE
ncbi:halocyanin domain-containing protein [Halostella sp. JP-L12]|uniref:halocyanin domain-containing protein n=1 Tax=Halostella TaxID=1843185 RepID=UPI000EF766A8|nr:MULTISPECIES: halocyanin domain-containing protein [Halostella]NHN49755.1 halocyanin domain-containing protein [Halostella sp. JP-L12]